MGYKSGFVRFFLLSLTILFVGCAELKELRKENTLLTQDLEAANSENDQLSRKYATSEEELSRLTEDRNRLENYRRDMEERLRGTGATVRIKDGKIAIVLPSSIYFKSGIATLRSDAKKSLKKVFGVIRSDFPNETIRIEGHTDSDPIKKAKRLYASNWELSAMRATNVLHFFVKECQLDPKKLYIAGFGKYQPIAGNKTKKDKEKNRRVEIVVLTDDSYN